MNRYLRALLGINVAAVPKLLGSGPRAFARACDRAYTAAQVEPPTPESIPEIDLDFILGDRHPLVSIRVQRYEDGMLPSDEAYRLLAILVAEQPREVLEIGTFMGHTTRLMAENLQSGMIHTVDLPQAFDPTTDTSGALQKDDYHLIRQRTVGREFRAHECRARIRQHFADTEAWDFRAAGNPTFFFIDGSHTYEYCKNDSEKCFALGTGPATFLWHDCTKGHPGVVRLLSEWRDRGRNVRRISGTTMAYWKRT